MGRVAGFENLSTTSIIDLAWFVISICRGFVAVSRLTFEPTIVAYIHKAFSEKRKSVYPT